MFSAISKKISIYSGRQWAVFLAFCMANLFAACVIALQAPFYPAEAERKGASATEYGLVFGIFQLVFFVVSPYFGKYMSKLGAKMVFNTGVFVVGLSCFAFGFLEKIDDHTAFITLSFLIRITEGIGSAALCTASFTIIAEEFPKSVATTFASLETFYGSGLIVGPTLGGALYELGGFVLPFTVMGLSLIIVALITLFLLPPATRAQKEEVKSGFGILTLLKLPAAAISGVSIFMCNSSLGFLNATLEPHLRQFQFTELYIGLIFMVGGASYAISAPIWGKLIDTKLHPKFVLMFGCLFLVGSHLMIGPAVFIPSQTTIWTVCAGLLIHGIGIGAIQVAGFILTLKESLANGFPDNLATYSVVSGLWASSVALGLFVGPSVGGYLLDVSNCNFRLASLFPLCDAVLVLGTVVYFIVFKGKDQRNSEYSPLLQPQDQKRPSLYGDLNKLIEDGPN